MKKFFVLTAFLPFAAWADEPPREAPADLTIPVLLQMMHNTQDQLAVANVKIAQQAQQIEQFQHATKPPLPNVVKPSDMPAAPSTPPPAPKEPPGTSPKTTDQPQNH